MVNVSVIVPVYNGENYISSCLKHLLSQSLNDIEIIVVDDGSKDMTVSKVNEFSDENIILISQKNAGAGEARNTGIKHAKGKYIAFLDVDDQYADNSTLQLLFSKAEENNALVCGGEMCDTSNKIMHGFEYEGIHLFEENPFDFGFTCFIYKRELFEDTSICFPPYKVYEDPVFLLKIMVKAKKFYFVKKAVYKYSGSHNANLNVEKTTDYLCGLADNLSFSSELNYSSLHKRNFERLINTGSYFYEINMNSANKKMFLSLINANQSIDKDLLTKEGINLSDNYLVPALETVLNSAGKYNSLRKLLFWKR